MSTAEKLRQLTALREAKAERELAAANRAQQQAVASVREADAALHDNAVRRRAEQSALYEQMRGQPVSLEQVMQLNARLLLAKEQAQTLVQRRQEALHALDGATSSKHVAQTARATLHRRHRKWQNLAEGDRQRARRHKERQGESDDLVGTPRPLLPASED